jgi:sugar (pentulose or hexulose) kinase
VPTSASSTAGACIEQDPWAWTRAAQTALHQLSGSLPRARKIVGVAVAATSGTFLLADDRNHPLTQGIMYNDLRAVDETDEVADALRPDLAPYGIEIASSFALTKIVHLARREPELFNRCYRVIHQTDWIVGMLCGRYDVTDVSTALKTGVDPGKLIWPAAIDRLAALRQRLPEIVMPGTPLGGVTATAADKTGLPTGTPVVAGCTDGTAGCLASGARRPGDLNVTLGTTLVFKAIADRPLIDPDGALYNHRHPAGGFLPGAASSTGGEWIDKLIQPSALPTLTKTAATVIPTNRTVYPLMRTGERFPFACPTATGFGLDSIGNPAERLAAGMEGVAYVERLGIERLGELGLTVGPQIYATGGAVVSETWLGIRAAVNRRTYSVPERPECAAGAAVLAAAFELGGCAAALSKIVRGGRCVEPDERLARAYDNGFQRFRTALEQRGYV